MDQHDDVHECPADWLWDLMTAYADNGHTLSDAVRLGRAVARRIEEGRSFDCDEYRALWAGSRRDAQGDA